jgi:Spy/CpxP family protein refolding chaperone
MARQIAWVIFAVLMSASVATASSLCDRQQAQDSKPGDAARAEDPPRWKWWLHPESRKELGITDKQSKKLNEIFESNMPQQQERRHQIEMLEEALSSTIKEHTADVATVTQQVEKLEKLRAEANTVRTVMLYRMALVLTPEQRVKVDEMRKRRDEARKKEDEARKKDPEQSS